MNPPATFEALTASVERLHVLVDGLDPPDLRRRAYPAEWTIADVLSHLGSGAVIGLMRLESGLAGVKTEMDAVRAVWDEWNAKAPEDQARDAGQANRSLLDALGSLTDDERRRFRSTVGPMEVDLDGFVLLRLSEHAVHWWDVAVVLDSDAELPVDATLHLVDNLALIARFSGRPFDHDRSVSVRTVDPVRHFEVRLGPDQVGIDTAGPPDHVDVELPAGAFVRLVYGRLDPDHTPAVDGDRAVLDELRHAFPGF